MTLSAVSFGLMNKTMSSILLSILININSVFSSEATSSYFLMQIDSFMTDIWNLSIHFKSHCSNEMVVSFVFTSSS